MNWSTLRYVLRNRLQSGSRIPRVSEICGAFFGGVFGVGGVGEGVVSAGAGLSQRGLEFGEDLLKRSIGSRSEEYLGMNSRPAPAARIVCRIAFALCHPRLSRITTSPGFGGRREELLDIALRRLCAQARRPSPNRTIKDAPGQTLLLRNPRAAANPSARLRRHYFARRLETLRGLTP
jgi:hypothetical protein